MCVQMKRQGVMCFQGSTFTVIMLELTLEMMSLVSFGVPMSPISQS